MSVTEDSQEVEVHQALQSIQDEFLPVKEDIMTLLEHLKKQGEEQGKKLGEKRGEKRGQRLGKASTLIRLLPASFTEFSAADADLVRNAPDEVLDHLTDAIAERRSWAEMEPLVRRSGEA